MIEFTETHFRELCGAPAVRERLEALEGERKDAIRKFWLRGVVGLGLAIAALVTLMNAGWDVVAWIVFVAFIIITAIAAFGPLIAAKEALKHPVLEALAKQGGLEYFPEGFEPPAFGSGWRLLFGGSGFSSQRFTDLFNGSDPEGRGYAVYEACLQRRSGKNTYTVFSGQMYALQRRGGGQAFTAIVPDRKILNFWKPASDMERVKFEGDDAFEKKFEVYSTVPMEARQLLDPVVRQLFLRLREKGRVFAYVGPDEALVAASGKDRFEPGSMFRSRAGEERVRMMFDDVCLSLGVLRELKARFG